MASELNSTLQIVPFGVRRATIIVPAVKAPESQGEARILYGNTADEAVSTFSISENQELDAD
jgi:hypothetical protein